jgi:hypothetical protein
MMQYSRTKVIQFERIEAGLTESPQGKKSNRFISPNCRTDPFFGTKVMSRNKWQQEISKTYTGLKSRWKGWSPEKEIWNEVSAKIWRNKQKFQAAFSRF